MPGRRWPTRRFARWRPGRRGRRWLGGDLVLQRRAAGEAGGEPVQGGPQPRSAGAVLNAKRVTRSSCDHSARRKPASPSCSAISASRRPGRMSARKSSASDTALRGSLGRPPSNRSPNRPDSHRRPSPLRSWPNRALSPTSRDRSAEPRSSSACKRSTEGAPSRIWQRDRVPALGIASPLAGMYGTSGPLGQLRRLRSPITASESTDRQPHRTSCQAATNHCPAAFPPISSPWPPSSTLVPSATTKTAAPNNGYRLSSVGRGRLSGVMGLAVLGGGVSSRVPMFCG
jgi:hypothetical protein